jgi:hypothetical protein
MLETKFTPGPWIKYETPTKFGVSSHYGRVFYSGITQNSFRSEEGRANATLAAAAPELFEALRQLKANAEVARSLITSEDQGADVVASALWDTILQADAAISKALGNSKRGAE